jgi:hypothetical protein
MKRKVKQKLTELQNEIRKAFAKKDMLATFGQSGQGWINIANPYGVHVEFYGNEFTVQGVTGMYVTASYRHDGEEEKDLDFSLPEELDQFVSVCRRILKAPPYSSFHGNGRWLKPGQETDMIEE